MGRLRVTFALTFAPSFLPCGGRSNPLGGQGCSLVVKLLLDAKAEVNATDGSGRTPLDAAYDCRHSSVGDGEEVARVLEAAGGVCKKDREKGWEEAEEEETKCK